MNNTKKFSVLILTLTIAGFSLNYLFAMQQPVVYDDDVAVVDQVTIISNDGNDFTIPVATAQLSVTLNDLIGEVGIGARIPLPNIDGPTLALVVECLTAMATEPPQQHKNTAHECLQATPAQDLIKLIAAANHLDIQPLIDAATKCLATVATIDDCHTALGVIKAAPLLRRVCMKFLQPQALTVRTFRVYSVAWSFDDAHLGFGSEDHNVIILDPKTGQRTQTLKGHQQLVQAIAWSPDGTCLASGSWDESIKIWNLETGECLQTLTGHDDCINTVAWSPHGKLFASGSDEIIKIWNTDTWECTQNIIENRQPINAIAWSPRGTCLAAGVGKTIKVWDHEWENTQTLIGHNRIVRAIAWSPCSKLLATGSDDHTIKIWHLETGECLQMLTEHAASVYSLAWNPDGSCLASGSSDHTIKIWDPLTGECLQTITGHTATATSVAWSSKGKYLASGSDDSATKIWNLRPTRAAIEAALPRITDRRLASFLRRCWNSIKGMS